MVKSLAAEPFLRWDVKTVEGYFILKIMMTPDVLEAQALPRFHLWCQ
jgi:hypothetical protein